MQRRTIADIPKDSKPELKEINEPLIRKQFRKAFKKRYSCSRMHATHIHRFKSIAWICAKLSYVYHQQFFRNIKKRTKHIKKIIPGRKKKSGREKITWR